MQRTGTIKVHARPNAKRQSHVGRCDCLGQLNSGGGIRTSDLRVMGPKSHISGSPAFSITYRNDNTLGTQFQIVMLIMMIMMRAILVAF